MRAVATLLALTLSLPLAAEQEVPDLSGFWNVSFGGEPGTALLEQLPEEAVFIDDAGGGELAEGDYSGLELSEAAKRQVEEYDFGSEFTRDFTCKRPSVAFYMQAPFPIEIHQGRDMIVMQIEYFDMYRIIFLDGREPSPDQPHSKSGFSVGHWEGDQLVVETTHISGATFMNNGFDHSDDLIMSERFKLSEDGNTLHLTQVYEDPAVFEGLAARYMAWRRADGHVYPYECDPAFGED